MKISVTQQHIDSGVRGSCTSDPIALALKDLGYERPWIGVHYIRLDKVDVHMPSEVYEFLKRFDNGLPPLDPFEFSLEF